MTSSTVTDIFDKIDKIKNDSEKNDGHNRSRSAFACLIVGGIAGLMIGYKRKWNLFYSAIGGGAIGAAIGTVLTPKS